MTANSLALFLLLAAYSSFSVFNSVSAPANSPDLDLTISLLFLMFSFNYEIANLKSETKSANLSAKA